jgi:hypothetical protein
MAGTQPSQRSRLSTNPNAIMNYMEEFEQELRQLSTNDVETIVRFAKERLLRSYRNGQASRGKSPLSSRLGPALLPCVLTDRAVARF